MRPGTSDPSRMALDERPMMSHKMDPMQRMSGDWLMPRYIARIRTRGKRDCMINLRPATPEDAPLMVDLVDLAGDGLPIAAWAAHLAETGQGGDARAFGIAHARRDRGGFTWRHAVIAEWDGVAAGMLMCWPLALEPRSLDGLPPVVVPIQRLENRARGRLLVNAVAVAPAFRRKGIGWMLLQTVTDRAALIVGDSNHAARTLYDRLGFVEIAREAAVGDAAWQPPHAEWCLMVRG